MKETSGPKTFSEAKARQTKMSDFILATVATGVGDTTEDQTWMTVLQLPVGIGKGMKTLIQDFQMMGTELGRAS